MALSMSYCISVSSERYTEQEYDAMVWFNRVLMKGSPKVGGGGEFGILKMF